MAEGFAGVKLRGGLPSDNGLAPLADDLVRDTSRVVYYVAAAKVDDVVHHVDTDTKTSVLRMIGIEADLTEEEAHAVRLVLDRARVRRTGESPLFDTAGEPANPADLVPGEDDVPGEVPPAGKRRGAQALSTV